YYLKLNSVLCSQLFSLCFFQLGNASHRFWTQDIPAPVTTDLQGSENRLESSSISHCGTQFCTRGRAPSTRSPPHFKHYTTFCGSKEKSLKSFTMKDFGFSYPITPGFGIWSLGSKSCCPFYNPCPRVAIYF
uniref:Uncharacterized protein n=1 Tax=Serinus canaria TaxID=9135 RepID=A0A8C9MK91_SERCA